MWREAEEHLATWYASDRGQPTTARRARGPKATMTPFARLMHQGEYLSALARNVILSRMPVIRLHRLTRGSLGAVKPSSFAR
jgi:hypothetical protein